MSRRAPRITGERLIRAFRREGWEVERVEGSHHIMKHPARPGSLVVPCHAGRILGQGLLRQLLTEAGVSVDRIRELL